MRRDVPSAAGRIARLLVMIGFAVTAFIALSSFDQAARADERLTDRLRNDDLPASVGQLASAVGDHAAPRRAEREDSAPRAGAPALRAAVRKTVPSTVERGIAVAPKPQGRKTGGADVGKRGSPAPAAERRPNTTGVKATGVKATGLKVTRLEATGREETGRNTTGLTATGRGASTGRSEWRAAVRRADVAGTSARRTATRAVERTTRVVTTVVTPPRPDRRFTAEREAFAAGVRATVSGLRTLPRPTKHGKRPATPAPPVVGALPSPAMRPSVPLTPAPPRPHPPIGPPHAALVAAPGGPQDAALVAAPGEPQDAAPGGPQGATVGAAGTPVAVTTAPPTTHTGSDRSAARVRCDVTGRGPVRQDSGEPGPAPAPPPPPPMSPSRPGGQSADAGHPCTSGGTAPPMGTVASPWWPDFAAADVPPPAHAHTTGRTVRYCGPPS